MGSGLVSEGGNSPTARAGLGRGGFALFCNQLPATVIWSGFIHRSSFIVTGNVWFDARVMAGLGPATHVFVQAGESRGWPAQGRP
jgi:hypothetical protein